MCAMAATVLPGLAETFVLSDGKPVEGTVLRTEGERVTIRTATGISSYDVSQFDEPTREKHFPGLGRGESSRMATARSAAVPQPPATSARETAMSHPVAPLILVVGGGILVLVGSLWFIIAGFAESPLWGIALLICNGLAGLAFLVLHWERAKSPVLMWLVGLGLMIGGVWIGK
jgi:hypothetical protein